MRIFLVKVAAVLMFMAVCLFWSGWQNIARSNSPLPRMDNSKGKWLTVNGMRFSRPAGYAVLPGSTDPDTVFLFDKKYKEGLFLHIAASPLDERKVLENLIKTGLTKFYPKESQDYVWKPQNGLKKLSKFEVLSGKAQAYNKSHLIIVEYRHIVFGEKHILLGNIFELEHGKEAEAAFNRQAEAESMGACNASVEIIYSLTGEKIDEDNPPCTIVTLAPAQ
jgi:hypothetical protein